MKRKNIIICAGLFMVLFMATVFVGCSDDDETTEVKAPTNLDESLLPGYWIRVKGGSRLDNGVWISDKSDIELIAVGIPVRFFELNGKEGAGRWLDTGYWYVNEGALSIWMWDRKITIMKLSSNRMTMRTRQIVTDEETMDEYERLSDPIEIEDKIDE